MITADFQPSNAGSEVIANAGATLNLFERVRAQKYLQNELESRKQILANEVVSSGLGLQQQNIQLQQQQNTLKSSEIALKQQSFAYNRDAGLRDAWANGDQEKFHSAVDEVEKITDPGKRYAAYSKVFNDYSKYGHLEEISPVITGMIQQGRERANVQLHDQFTQAISSGAPLFPDAPSAQQSYPGRKVVNVRDPLDPTGQRSGFLVTPEADPQADFAASQRLSLALANNDFKEFNAAMADPIVSAVAGIEGSRTQKIIQNHIQMMQAGREMMKFQNDQIDKQRDAFSKDERVLTFNKVSAEYKAVNAAAGLSNPNRQTDNDMLFSYFKMIDPSMGVRAQNVEDITKLTGIPERIKQLANTYLKNGVLTPQQRKDIRTAAKLLLETRYSEVKPVMQQFYRESLGRGIDPTRILTGDDIGRLMFGADYSPENSTTSVNNDLLGTIIGK